MNLRFPAVLLMCASAAIGSAQDPKNTKPEQDPLKEMLALFEKVGLEFDRKAKTITVEADAGIRDQPIEFALIHLRGKKHEGMFVTQVKASVLNAALLALGWEKGDNAKIVDKDPMPTEEQIRAGAPMFDVIPPSGMPMWFTVKWTAPDDDGKDVEHEFVLEDLILDMATDRPVEDTSWVFLGGNLAPIYRGEPPVFVGDYEGNLISVVYKHPPNHLATMSHEGADDDQRWWFTNRMPEPGARVKFTIHRNKPKLVLEREKRIVAQKKKRAADGKDGAGR